ncbi:G-protein coupled receptor 39 [Heterocephalus glaber]|uniref:G-protein coupled receptor 39 n=1 Tax=Heterocephalus glaber TaxID=10181 RepID=G5BU55_HETGA|nr:G-protein coupled receptor 39 [Heterocephalus glaber]
MLVVEVEKIMLEVVVVLVVEVEIIVEVVTTVVLVAGDEAEMTVELVVLVLAVWVAGEKRGGNYHGGGRLIVVTLAVCWMPNQIRRIMAAAKPKYDWTKSYFRAYMILLPFSNTFFYLSSVVNPLLYNVSSLQFRRVFGQVLRCHLKLPHANQEKRLRAQGSCSTDSARSARSPLIFFTSQRNSSVRRTNKVFLSTFQSQAMPKTKLQPLSQESAQPNSEMKPVNSATEKGFQEHEV